jgi:hypothetical protein
MTIKTATSATGAVTKLAANSTTSGQAPAAQAAQTSFGRTLESLLGKHAATSKVNEEELFAAAVCQQLKDTYGTDFSKDFKVAFKLSMASTSGHESFPSPERAAKEALRFLVQSGRLTVDEARTIRQVAFQAAQLDANLNKLYDSHGGAGDETVATARFSRAQSLVAQRLAAVAESTSTKKKTPTVGARLNRQS